MGMKGNGGGGRGSGEFKSITYLGGWGGVTVVQCPVVGP